MKFYLNPSIISRADLFGRVDRQTYMNVKKRLFTTTQTRMTSTLKHQTH